jgi:hypothetical protein
MVCSRSVENKVSSLVVCGENEPGPIYRLDAGTHITTAFSSALGPESDATVPSEPRLPEVALEQVFSRLNSTQTLSKATSEGLGEFRTSQMIRQSRQHARAMITYLETSTVAPFETWKVRAISLQRPSLGVLLF